MSDFNVCPTCKEYGFLSKHTCPPVWYIKDPEYNGDELVEIHASYPDEAAKKYGEAFDMDGDYTIIGGTDIVVTVYSSPLKKDGKKFNISAETTINYSVDEISG